MSNVLRIEHLCESSNLAGSELASFHVSLNSFQCTPTRITAFVRNVSDERFIDMEQSLSSMFLLLST